MATQRMTQRAIRPLSAALLPGFDPEVIACREALRGRMAPWPVRVAGGDYGLEWQEQGPSVRQGLETAVRIGPWRYVLQVETGSGNFAPLGVDVGAMPSVVARALVAEFCADAVRMVERASGLRIELDAVWSLSAGGKEKAAPEEDKALGFVLREQASGLCTRAAVIPQDAAALAGLARLCAGWPWQRAAGRAPWPLRCRLLLGSTRLAVWELGQLEVADVLFIEHPPPGRARVRAALFFGHGETSAFLAHMQDREISILDDKPSHQVMLDGADDEASGEASLLDRVELTVRFWIGGRRFAWREIQALQAGSVLTLDHDVADAEVLLVVDGQRIGRGRLVAVGDKLGVRIASIAPPDPQAPAQAHSRPAAQPRTQGGDESAALS
jgi:type III secretion protein Q